MPSTSLPRLSRLLAVLIPIVALAGCFDNGDGPESIPGMPQAQASEDQLVLVFSDEFDEGTMPNPEKWNIETGYGPNDAGWGNDEWQRYTDSSDNVRVEGGNLVIQARCDMPPCGIRDDSVTSARLNTQGNFDFRYGRIEARIQAPTGKAAWPAFWSLGANFPGVPWPRAGEIDFMELFDNGSDENTTHFTMHWCAAQPDSCDFPNGYATQTQSLTTDEDLGDDFHIYSAEWNANQVTGKIDGITYFVANIDPATMEEFRRRFFLIFNVAMGGTLGSGTQPPAGDETWPQTMLVDWVRVYQREADIGGGESGVIDFEEGGAPYTFINFEGGVGVVVDNPVPTDFNNSPRVAQFQKFRAESGEVFGGSRLEIPQEVPANTVYRAKVYSQREVRVTFKLEETTTGVGGTESEVTHGGTGWEEMEFEFIADSGSYPGGITFIFDNGILGDAGANPADWTFYVDDIEQVTVEGPPEGQTSFDFEDDGAPYFFTGFAGGVPATVEDNPQMDALNPSAKVAEMRKAMGEVFAGTTLLASMTVTEGNAYTMKVLSQRSVRVTLRLENGAMIPPEVEVSHGGTGWEELRFEFPEFSGSITGLTTIFDNGTVGDFGGDPIDWTFYVDDIELVPSDPDALLDQIDLPITFDDPNVNYTVVDFGDPVSAMTTRVADPDDPTNMVASTVKPVGAPDWAGTTMSTTAGLASSIPFTATDTTIGIRVYPPAAGIPVRLKAEVLGDATAFVEVDATTTVANAWQTLVFDFANPIAGSPALDPNADYRLLSVFFNIGTDGDTAGTQTYRWDDVEFGVLPPDIDEMPPSLTSVSIASSNNVSPTLARAGDTVTVTFIADEPLATPMVMIAGAPADMLSGAGANWAASRTLSGADTDGLVSIDIAYADLAGNAGMVVTSTTDGSSVTLDTMAPTVSIDNAPMSFTTLDPIAVTFQFNEPVNGFLRTDIVVTNGSRVANSFMTVDAATYTAEYTPSGAGDLTLSVAAGVAMDAAGNLNTMAAPVTVTNALVEVPLDELTIFSDNANADDVATAGDVVTLDMTAPAAIDEPTVTIAGSPADTVTGSGANWQASRTMLMTDTEGEIAFQIDFDYADGSPGLRTTGTTDGSSVTFDVTAPTLTIDGLPDPINAMETATVTFEFNEDVTGFDLGDIMVTNGSADAFVPTDAANYAADITADGNGDVTVTVAAAAATDQAGNENEAATETATLNASPTYTMLWSDDFSSAFLNAANWTARENADCPDPCPGAQDYLMGRVSVGAGFLNIVAENVARGGGNPFTSGLVDTLGKQQLRYGKIEIEARMPGTQGTLPSFWLLPVSEEYGPWPQSGQIDIVNAPEIGVAADDLNHAARYGLPVPEDTITDFDYLPPFAPNGSVHTYAIEWNAEEIRWYVDGVNVATQIAPNWYAYFEDDDGVFTEGTGGAPFDQDFYLLIGLAMGDNANIGTYPQTLSIDEVRVFECTNPDNPALGTGCITGIAENVLTPEGNEGSPYRESLTVYTDAPATVDFVDPENPGTPAPQTLVPGTEDLTVVSNPAMSDGGNIVWNLDISAPADMGTAFVRAPDNGAQSGYFNFSGGEAAGELLFRMRVNSATVADVDIGLSGLTGAGSVAVPIVPDGVWRIYSLKLGEIVTNSVPSLDLATVTDLFTLTVTNGSANLDLDDISVKVACREVDGCSAEGRLPTVFYEQDFNTLDMASPTAISADGWTVGANVFEPDGVTFLYNYFSFPAPNGGAAFSAIVMGEGGPTQEPQQLSVYNDYNNSDHGVGNRIEANFFQEYVIQPEDVGSQWVLSFDAKAGNIEGASTAQAFLKTIDGSGNLSNIFSVDTTNLPTEWGRFEVILSIDDGLPGQRLQFGFLNVASNFEGSGVFYDNVALTIFSSE